MRNAKQAHAESSSAGGEHRADDEGEVITADQRSELVATGCEQVIVP